MTTTPPASHPVRDGSFLVAAPPILHGGPDGQGRNRISLTAGPWIPTDQCKLVPHAFTTLWESVVRPYAAGFGYYGTERQQELLDRARSAMHADHAGQAPTSPVVATLVEAGSLEVWVLRRWDRHHDEVTLWPDEDAALKQLAAYARSNWANVACREDVPDQPPADDRDAVRLYYGPKGERGDEDYTIYADEVHKSVPPSGTRLVTKDYQFPSEEDCDRANRSAVFHPVRAEDGLPCIEVGGVLVFLYLDPDEEAVRISIHLDTVDEQLVRPDDTVPLRADCENGVIFDDPHKALPEAGD
ncbi:hypothetical protein GCM10010411_76650 [Actinomadura fulvescens]|uniref:Uncharacterized protein n=1 Tax=Actinomadura fulvescens TaxID=46160 RepID=A0ABN3QKW1_9ACTN